MTSTEDSHQPPGFEKPVSYLIPRNIPTSGVASPNYGLNVQRHHYLSMSLDSGSVLKKN